MISQHVVPIEPPRRRASTTGDAKEALKIGSDNSVSLTGKTDGYFGNELIKILMPEQLDPAARVTDPLKQVFGK